MKGFSPQNLKYMRRFAEEYSLDEIGQLAVDQLTWDHHQTNPALICRTEVGQRIPTKGLKN